MGLLVGRLTNQRVPYCREWMVVAGLPSCELQNAGTGGFGMEMCIILLILQVFLLRITVFGMKRGRVVAVAAGSNLLKM